MWWRCRSWCGRMRWSQKLIFGSTLVESCEGAVHELLLLSLLSLKESEWILKLLSSIGNDCEFGLIGWSRRIWYWIRIRDGDGQRWIGRWVWSARLVCWAVRSDFGGCFHGCVTRARGRGWSGFWWTRAIGSWRSLRSIESKVSIWWWWRCWWIENVGGLEDGCSPW